MEKASHRTATGSLFVLDQHRPAPTALQSLAGGGGLRPPMPPAAAVPADAPRPNNGDPRPKYLKNIMPPSGAMGQINFRGWLRFLIASGQLNAFEMGVVKTVMRQKFPSAKQRTVLWYALYRVAPWGCGKWGAPD
jgi:hypothetical protein